MWDGASFALGLVVGMIILLLITWLTYSSRTFVFSYCPRTLPTCKRNQYINDPAEAAAHGEDMGELLTVRNGVLYFKRPTNTNDCIPLARNEVVAISHPQYCEFTLDNGMMYNGVKIAQGAYTFTDERGVTYEVETGINCVPERSTPQGVVKGHPLPFWYSDL